MGWLNFYKHAASCCLSWINRQRRGFSLVGGEVFADQTTPSRVHGTALADIHHDSQLDNGKD